MNNQNMSMDELMSDFELKNFRKGEIVKGKVISVSNEELIVNIGHFADGIVARNEISNDKDFDINSINIDDEIYVMVLKGDDGEGNVELSKKRADAVKAWDNFEEIFNQNKTITIKISEVVKGGVVAFSNGVRVFMPFSQCAAKRIENLEDLVGKTLEVKIIEFNKEDRKVVVSRRIIEEEIIKNEKKKLYKSITVGEKITGTVTKILKFGAFVNVRGVEGLIHINDLAWTRVKKVEDILSVGDTVEVQVKDVDFARERIALSLKDVAENPWTKLERTRKIGETVNAKVVRFISVGAIVEIEDGVEGLVHISEITDENITSAETVLKLGQEVKVKILSIDAQNQKLSLSIKDANESSKEYLQYNDEEDGFSLGDMFKDFKFE